jgi:hypothetical protein
MLSAGEGEQLGLEAYPQGTIHKVLKKNRLIIALSISTYLLMGARWWPPSSLSMQLEMWRFTECGGLRIGVVSIPIDADVIRPLARRPIAEQLFSIT